MKKSREVKPHIRYTEEKWWGVVGIYPDESKMDKHNLHGPRLWPIWEEAYRFVIHQNMKLAGQA